MPVAKTKHLAFGTAVHSALFDFLAQFNATGTIPKAGYVTRRFLAHLDREILSDAERADARELGTEALRRYVQQYAQSFSPGSLLEYDFRRHGVHVDDIRLTGKLDKIEIVDEAKKLVVVVDYKTGNPDSAARHFRNGGGDYWRQLVFYKLLTELSPQFPYTMVRGELDFIQPSRRTGQFIKKAYEVSPSDTKELAETIRQVWSEIKALKFLEAEGCGECEYCLRA